MRFTLSSTALSSKLTALSRVINSKNSLPILADFIFEIEGNTLRLTASDSENMMKTSVELNESDGDGRFAIGSHNLLEAVKGLSEQPLTVEVNNEENIARIIYQNGQFSLPTDSAEEFPQAQPIGDNATVITIANDLLVDNINRSIFATGQDELRPVMNGIYFDLTQECLAIVGTDGHKNVLQKDGSEVTIRFDERNAEINYSDGVITCRLIEGRYPNYNSVIPQNNPNRLTVDRNAMLSALRRVQPFANSTNLIKFHMENGSLQLDAEDYDFSKTATERMSCDYNGQPMSIGFNGSSFIEILSNFDCQEVIIQLADPSRAGVVVPAEQPADRDVLMLLMPMFINE